MIPVPDLLVYLSRLADAGDEEAAISVNSLVASYPAFALQAAQMLRRPVLVGADATAIPDEPKTLGDILAEAFNATAECAVDPDTSPWRIVDAAADLIAHHYGFDAGEVFGTLCGLEADYHSSTGEECFGALLNMPWGFSTLGLRVAQELIGAEEADALPLLHISIH